MVIDWSAPAGDNNVAVDYYQVLIIDSAGDYIEVTSICDGQDSDTITNTECSVAMTAFWAAPYSLPQSSEIKAKVLAHNDRGWSAESAISTTFETV